MDGNRASRKSILSDLKSNLNFCLTLHSLLSSWPYLTEYEKVSSSSSSTNLSGSSFHRSIWFRVIWSIICEWYRVKLNQKKKSRPMPWRNSMEMRGQGLKTSRWSIFSTPYLHKQNDVVDEVSESSLHCILEFGRLQQTEWWGAKGICENSFASQRLVSNSEFALVQSPKTQGFLRATFDRTWHDTVTPHLVRKSIRLKMKFSIDCICSASSGSSGSSASSGRFTIVSQ